MIFLLDIILSLNLLWAYKSFKNILSPPVLVGAGMLIASLVATSYYEAWEMYKICFETVVYIGGGTLFFTLSCLPFLRKHHFSNGYSNLFDQNKLDITRIKCILLFLNILGAFTCYIKFIVYGAYFGTMLGFSELMSAVRMDTWTGESEFGFPIYVRLMAKILLIFSYMVSFIFSVHFFSSKKDKMVMLLCINVLVLCALDGVISGGAKGEAMERLFAYITIFVFVFFYKRNSYGINIRLFILFALAFLLFYNVFSVFNESIGRERNTDVHNKSSIWSIYIGAQIKNFDIYIKGQDGNDDTNYYGGETFKTLYSYIDKNYHRNPGRFQVVRTNTLGNVYTQYYAYHKDFGILGIWVVIMLSAILVMFFYNKACDCLYNFKMSNLHLYAYSFMTLPLFMSFFSPRLCECVLSVSFVINLILIYLFASIFKSICLNKKI